MPGPPYKPLHRPASPRRTFFDPWNSASTGHQRAENRLSGSTSWRHSRSKKLHAQFSADLSGGQRISHTVGAGSEHFGEDGRTDTGWEDSVLGWRGRNGIGKDQGDVSVWLNSENVGKKRVHTGETGDEEDEREKRRKKGKLFDETNAEMRENVLEQEIESDSEGESDDCFPPPSAQPRPRSPSPLLPNEPPPPFGVPKRSKIRPSTTPQTTVNAAGGLPQSGIQALHAEPRNSPPDRPPQIFSQLTIFINGSTLPHISDHKLKHQLTAHGARMSLGLARKEVTHVILGRPNVGTKAPGEADVGSARLKGAGGGLAGGKLQKEVISTGQGVGKGVKYVGVEWVLESIKAGRRLPESRFSGICTAPAGVKSVRSFFVKDPG